LRGPQHFAGLHCAAGRGINAIRNEIEQSAGHFLRIQIDGAGAGVEVAAQRDIEFRFSARAP
jgi:hypothetical protein